LCTLFKKAFHKQYAILIGMIQNCILLGQKKMFTGIAMNGRKCNKQQYGGIRPAQLASW